MERENQDLALEQIRLKAAEQRVTVLESIKWVERGKRGGRKKEGGREEERLEEGRGRRRGA